MLIFQIEQLYVVVFLGLQSKNICFTDPEEQDLPTKFKKLLNVPNKIGQVILLGNCTKSENFLKFANQISPNIVLIRGELDDTSVTFPGNIKEDIPINTVIKQGEFKIGCCNGYTLVPKNDPLSLLILARQLDVDIMLWGGTHNVEAYTLEGKFFINPGSCTGTFSTDWINTEYSVKSSTTLDGSEEPTNIQTNTLTDGLEHHINEKSKNNPSNLASQNQSKEIKCKDDVINKNMNMKDNDSESDDSIDDIDIYGGIIPSFCLLDIQGSTCNLYVYTYVDGDVKVDKVVYKKSCD